MFFQSVAALGIKCREDSKRTIIESFFMARTIIGIDFGSTQSSVSYITFGAEKGTNPEFIKYKAICESIPTVILLDNGNQDEVLAWGHEINDHIKNDKSGRYLLKSDFKRELGQDDLANKCCKVPEDFYHSVRCRKVTPEDFVFRSTKEDTFVIGVKSGSLITEKRICKLPLEKWRKTL